MPETLPRLGTSWAALLVLLALALPATGASAGTSEDGGRPTEHPVVERALRDLGTYQGQCWPWVRRVVSEATGRTMGFDYRQGYLDGGAIEVALAEAKPGDIIQLAQDANTGPWADYPGLHTAIIVARSGPSAFRVIDSNSQWDGVVRLRENYDPVEAAARFAGISYRIYRFTADAGFTPAVPSTSTQPLPDDGARATVSTPADCLRLRTSPAITPGNIVTCLPDGSTVVVTGATAIADGYEWLKVATPWGNGWVASAFVRLEATGSPPGGGQARPFVQYRAVIGGIAVDAR